MTLHRPAASRALFPIRTLPAALLLGATLAAAPVAGLAQTYPAKPIRVIVPFAPGGATDVLARLTGQKLGEAWGHQVIVDNRPGAGGNIGAELGAKAPPDGYTLLLAAAGFMAVHPTFYAKLAYDPAKDYAPITLFVTAPLLMVVHPSVPARSAKDLIGIMKAQPGKVLFGNGGTGTAQHLGAVLFQTMGKVDFTHVPYKGSAPATIDLLGGQVMVMMDNMVTLIEHVKSGKLRPLGVSSAKRVPTLPDIPTIAESGIPGFDTGTWYGIVAPAATPKPVVDRLNAEYVRILGLPDIRQKLADMGLVAAPMTPDQFGSFIRAEIEKFGKLVKASGARAD